MQDDEILWEEKVQFSELSGETDIIVTYLKYFVLLFYQETII